MSESFVFVAEIAELIKKKRKKNKKYDKNKPNNFYCSCGHIKSDFTSAIK